MHTNSLRDTSSTRSSKSGSALALTVIFIAILTMLAAGILRAAVSHRLVAVAQVRLEQALYAAEAAVAEAAQLLVEHEGFITGSSLHGSGSEGGANFTYRIQQLPGWKQFSIHTTGTVNGVSRRIDIDRAYFPTYANFSMWTRLNGVIYYIPGEVFDGLVHADSQMWFWSNEIFGGAVFSNRVTSLAPNYGGDIGHVTFREGFERGVTNGSLAEVNFNSLRSRAQSSGLLLEGNTRISIEGHRVRITNARRGWNRRRVTLQPNQLIYVADATSGSSSTRAGRVELDGGTLDGRMTIVSDDDVLINNHLRYAQDPRDDDPQQGIFSHDALGLISKDDVWVTQDAPNNLEIFAAIMATGRRPNDDGNFGVLNFQSGGPRGELMIYGSLVQDVRAGVGTFNNWGIVSGYSKNYQFDKRFRTSAPPFYPELSNRIEFVGWSDGPVL